VCIYIYIYIYIYIHTHSNHTETETKTHYGTPFYKKIVTLITAVIFYFFQYNIAIQPTLNFV